MTQFFDCFEYLQFKFKPRSSLQELQRERIRQRFLLSAFLSSKKRNRFVKETQFLRLKYNFLLSKEIVLIKKTFTIEEIAFYKCEVLTECVTALKKEGFPPESIYFFHIKEQLKIFFAYKKSACSIK
jgi:hypothetical protein